MGAKRPLKGPRREPGSCWEEQKRIMVPNEGLHFFTLFYLPGLPNIWLLSPSLLWIAIDLFFSEYRKAAAVLKTCALFCQKREGYCKEILELLTRPESAAGSTDQLAGGPARKENGQCQATAVPRRPRPSKPIIMFALFHSCEKM